MVILADREFEELYPENVVNSHIEEVGAKIAADYAGKDFLLVPVADGGYYFGNKIATILSRHGIPYVLAETAESAERHRQG